MPPPSTAALTVLATVAVAVATTATGCTAQPPVTPSTSASPSSPAQTAPSDAWGQLAGRVAAAQDRRYVASYAQTVKGRPASTLVVTIATDQSWLVTIPGGALGGTADVTLADTTAGVFQCPLLPTPTCYSAGTSLPAKNDPRFEHLFTDWLTVLRDRQVALSVAVATTPAGVRGECFSVEPSSASLAPPVDAGIYCFDSDGTMTAATLGVGSLVLIGGPAAAPATVTLPGPVVPGPLLGTASPPPAPSPSPSSASPSPSKKP